MHRFRTRARKNYGADSPSHSVLLRPKIGYQPKLPVITFWGHFVLKKETNSVPDLLRFYQGYSNSDFDRLEVVIHLWIFQDTCFAFCKYNIIIELSWLKHFLIFFITETYFSK